VGSCRQKLLLVRHVGATVRTWKGFILPCFLLSKRSRLDLDPPRPELSSQMHAGSCHDTYSTDVSMPCTSLYPSYSRSLGSALGMK
jgi:hypothetical protein